MICISAYSSYSRRILPAGLGGGREEVLRHVGWQLYGVVVWDGGSVPRRGWVWQKGYEEDFPSTGISTTATI